MDAQFWLDGDAPTDSGLGPASDHGDDAREDGRRGDRQQGIAKGAGCAHSLSIRYQAAGRPG